MRVFQRVKALEYNGLLYLFYKLPHLVGRVLLHKPELVCEADSVAPEKPHYEEPVD